MISIEGLTVEFGGFTFLDKITYVINKKDRIALVGKNGAGKSTMLKIIAGLQQPSAGSVNMPKDITIGYLPQQMQLSDSRTVTEEAALAFSHIQEMQERLDQMNTELAERTDYESDSYQELIDRISQVSEQLALSGNGNYQAEIEKRYWDLVFCGVILTDRLPSSVAAGVCVSNWPNCFCNAPMYCCSTSLLTIWT